MEDFNAKAQRREDAKEEVEPRISRMTRIGNPSFLIRVIREIRGRKSFRQFLFASLRLCAFALKSDCMGAD